MKLDITRLLRAPEGAQAFDLVQEWENIDFSGEDVRFPEPVRFVGRATWLDDSGLVRVAGTFSATVRRDCHRCLEETDESMEMELDELFAREVDQDEERFLYKGEVIDLDEMLQQNLLLRLPMRVVCSPECKGLCPRCGAPLNQGPCNCPPEEKVLHPGLQQWLQENKEV